VNSALGRFGTAVKLKINLSTVVACNDRDIAVYTGSWFDDLFSSMIQASATHWWSEPLRTTLSQI
jgi:hypothetical protein